MSLFSVAKPSRPAATNPFAAGAVGRNEPDAVDDQDSFLIYINSLQKSSDNVSLSVSSSRNSLILLESPPAPTPTVPESEPDEEDFKNKDNLSQNNWFIDGEPIVVSGTDQPNNENQPDSDEDQNYADDGDLYDALTAAENGVENPETEFCKNILAFDAHSGPSLRYFLNLNHQKIATLIERDIDVANNSTLKKSSSASSFLPNDTSPTNTTAAMNVANKKRGLFSRASKSATANASNASIHEQHGEENGKLKSSSGGTPSSPSTTSHHLNELDEDRFDGDGVMFQGKLIGHEYVAEARGEQMCQQSLKKLKIVQKHLGGHKRKVNMYISFDGIKIQDSNTRTELFHHSVPQISFISRDETDTRAFGYVFGNSQTGHQFIGIKTKKEAMVVMSTIGQLFAITLKRKRSAEEAAAAAAAASSTVYYSADEPVYHSVQDQQQQPEFHADEMINLSSSGGSNKSRARLRTASGSTNENVPIPILPPPLADQHSSRHRHHHGGHQQQPNRFSNDFNNNNQPKTASQTLINEFDLFQPSSATNLGASMDSSLPKDSKLTSAFGAAGGTNRLAQTFDWAHFGDDDNCLSQSHSQAHDDSTLNTISSISDTLTATTGNVTLNESATLVAGSGAGPNDVVIYSNYVAPQHGWPNANTGGGSKLTSSSTTISSANFDGIDPFSDAFGDDPFSTASTTADISSNVLSAPAPLHQPPAPPHQNRPPLNPNPGTMFDSNRLCLKNQGADSVSALADSFGSINLNKSNDGNSFKSGAELSRGKESGDKYAVLHDIASISTSIFDSLGGGSSSDFNPGTIIPNMKEPQPETRSRPGSNLSKTMPLNRVDTDGFAMFPPQSAQTAANFASSVAPTSFCNVSYQQQQQQSQMPYGANGVVVLPPLSNQNQNGGFPQPNDFGYPATYHQNQSVSNNQWATKSFDEVRTEQQQQARNASKFGLGRAQQAPRAEFDSLSNLSSTSSNASSSTVYPSAGKLPATTTDSKSESVSIPVFQDLDPLNKSKPFTSAAFVLSAETGNRNRSPMLNAVLDSSLASSINSSNSSLFTNNSRNCSTPSSLHQNRKSSPQLISQNSLPNQATATMKTAAATTIPLAVSIPTTSTSYSPPVVVTTENPAAEVSGSGSATKNFTQIVTTTATIDPNPHYIMLYNLNSASTTSPRSADSEPSASNKDQKSLSEDNNRSDSLRQEEESGVKKDVGSSPSSAAQVAAASTMGDDPNLDDDKANDEDHGGLKPRSRTSSISSSSNSLLINQSNFSELKFDEVFDSPLLDHGSTSRTNNRTANNSGDILQPEKESDVQKSTESVCSTKSNPESGMKPVEATAVGNRSAGSGARGSLSRQSSACSTPPAIPPRTDLHFKYHNENPSSQQQAGPPPPLPQPLHQYHQHQHSPYSHRMPAALQHHYGLPPPPPYYSSAQQQTFYPGYPPDPYGDPTGTLRRHSSSSSSQSRYWNSGYDWYGSSPLENAYGLPRPLDYAPPLPLPQHMHNVYGAPPDYPMAAYQYPASRSYYGPPPPSSGPGSPWHDYYSQPAHPQHHSTGHPHHPQPPHIVHAHAPPLHHPLALSTSSPSSNSSPRAGHHRVDKTTAKNTGQCSSTPPLPPPPPLAADMDGSASTPPPLPNPQRRISASSKASSVGTGAAADRGMATEAAQPPSNSLNRTASMSSSALPGRDFYDYPPPPHHYGDDDKNRKRPDSGTLELSEHQTQPLTYEQSSTSSAAAAAAASQLSSHHQSQFASFNSNMEQMLMRYHHQPPGHRAISPYEYGHHGLPSYATYHARVAATMMPTGASVFSLGSNSSGSSGYSSAHINHQHGGQTPMNMMDHQISVRTSPNHQVTAWATGSPPVVVATGNQPPPPPQSQAIGDDGWQDLERKDPATSEQSPNNNMFEDDFSSVMFSANQTNKTAAATGEGQFDTVKRGPSTNNKTLQQNLAEEKRPESLDNRNETEVAKTAEATEVKTGENSPDDRNIFVAKDDPFEDDDFFKS